MWMKTHSIGSKMGGSEQCRILLFKSLVKATIIHLTSLATEQIPSFPPSLPLSCSFSLSFFVSLCLSALLFSSFLSSPFSPLSPPLPPSLPPPSFLPSFPPSPFKNYWLWVKGSSFLKLELAQGKVQCPATSASVFQDCQKIVLESREWAQKFVSALTGIREKSGHED